MKLEDCIYDGKGDFKIGKCPTNARIDKAQRAKYDELTAQNTARMAQLQDKLYAEAKEGVVVLFQAMDAAGKDSTIKRVMSGVNPQGVVVENFKQPSKEELAHSFMWRVFKAMPARGYIGLFNRSYYEDVLVVRVHNMQKGYSMPKRCTDMPDDEFFDKRLKYITLFEEYLHDNGLRVVKIFLNVGKVEQKKRFLARIDDPAKNWKFSESDIKERALWDKYQDAYEKAINATGTKQAPWYVIPADQKWYARYLVSEAIVRVLEDIDPHYPDMPDEQKAKLSSYRDVLTSK